MALGAFEMDITAQCAGRGNRAGFGNTNKLLAHRSKTWPGGNRITRTAPGTD
jgi:hypothetical protein